MVKGAVGSRFAAFEQEFGHKEPALSIAAEKAGATPNSCLTAAGGRQVGMLGCTCMGCGALESGSQFMAHVCFRRRCWICCSRCRMESSSTATRCRVGGGKGQSVTCLSRFPLVAPTVLSMLLFAEQDL